MKLHADDVGAVGWVLTAVSGFCAVLFGVTGVIGSLADSRDVMLAALIGMANSGVVLAVGLYMGGFPAGSGPGWMKRREERVNKSDIEVGDIVSRGQWSSIDLLVDGGCPRCGAAVEKGDVFVWNTKRCDWEHRDCVDPKAGDTP